MVKKIDADVSPDTVIGNRYRLIEQIGKGGMGVVWRAHDPEGDRSVAIKIIRPRASTGTPSKQAVGRFLREAAAMSSLRSRHIAHVFDHGEHDGLVFLAMEFVSGVTLRKYIRQNGRKLDSDKALQVVTHIGRAAALAHQRGIVHRDLKPGNVIVAQDGEGIICKVLDFGLAKMLGGGVLGLMDPVRTQAGKPLGTPYYMSPEQALGQGSVDHRSDLWGIGVIAFECICGQRPFDGKSLAEIFAKLVRGSVPAPSTITQVPEGFDQWMARALERDVQRRFQSARVMVSELREVLRRDISHTMTEAAAGDFWSTVAEQTQTVVRVPEWSDRSNRKSYAGPSSSFVGRVAEMATMQQAVVDHCRVLTLCGSPGVGRSRLAHEFSAKHADGYVGGIFVVKALGTESASDIVKAVATVVGARLSAGSAELRVGRSLSGIDRCVLIIENVSEDAGPELGRMMTEWLRLAPHVLFIVTTSSPLQCPTERTVAVNRLEPPPPDQVTLAQTKAFEGGELFLRRSIAFNRQILALETVGASIGECVRLTDGIPLAIELVASCMRMIPPHLVAHGLSRSVARGESPLSAERRLKLTIAWVWAQLPLAERSALLQCAAFRGEFSAEAAEAVIDLSAWPDAPSPAKLLDNFAHINLVRCDVLVGSETLFQLHPAVRSACDKRLRDGRALLHPDDETSDPRQVSQDVRRRHAAYYSQFGNAEALSLLRARGGQRRRAAYIASEGNFRQALEFDDAALQSRLAIAAAAAIEVSNHHPSRAELLAAPLEADQPDASSPLRLRVQIELARARLSLAHHDQGQYELAQETIDDAVAAIVGTTPQTVAAEALLCQSAVFAFDHQAERALTAARHARAASERAGDPLLAGRVLDALSVASREAGNEADARNFAGEALKQHRHLGAPLHECGTLLALSDLALSASTPVDAAALKVVKSDLQSALALAHELASPHHEAVALRSLSHLARHEQRDHEALALGEQAVRCWRRIGDVPGESGALADLSAIQAAVGDSRGAWETLRHAEELLRADGHATHLLAWVETVCRRGHLELAMGDVRAAQNTAANLSEFLRDVEPGAAHDLVRRLMVSIGPISTS